MKARANANKTAAVALVKKRMEVFLIPPELTAIKAA
jgi:hypothetical protein